MIPPATVKNEAADVLRLNFRSQTNPMGLYHGDNGYRIFRRDLDAALAAERRATVERLRALTDEAVEKWGIEALPTALLRIFASEAHR